MLKFSSYLDIGTVISVSTVFFAMLETASFKFWWIMDAANAGRQSQFDYWITN